MILQFKALVMELRNSKLLEKFGTRRTEDDFDKEVQLIEPFTEI